METCFMLILYQHWSEWQSLCSFLNIILSTFNSFTLFLELLPIVLSLLFYPLSPQISLALKFVSPSQLLIISESSPLSRYWSCVFSQDFCRSTKTQYLFPLSCLICPLVGNSDLCPLTYSCFQGFSRLLNVWAVFVTGCFLLDVFVFFSL